MKALRGAALFPVQAAPVLSGAGQALIAVDAAGVPVISVNGQPYAPIGSVVGAAAVQTLAATPATVNAGVELVKIPGNAIGAAVFVGLPLAADNPGRRITFKNLQLFAATFTTVTTIGGDTLDLGFFTGVITGDFSAITMQSDGVSDWSLVGAV